MTVPRRIPKRPADPPVSAEQHSVLTLDLTVTGHIDATGDVQLFGTVAGHVKGRKVTLWHQSFVEGEIRAEEVHIHGRVKGRVYARTVVIGESARIEGHIFNHKVEVAKGAQVKGRLPWRPATYFDSPDSRLEQTG